ncbi:HAD-IIB family hydrolase [soil metagenome]
MKSLIIFDLDGTLAESKSSLDAEMSDLMHRLLEIVKVAVISGGAWEQFQKQLLHDLPQGETFKNLSILPTCGTKFFTYDGDWKELYSEDLTPDEKKLIFDSFNKAVEQAGFKVEQTWGETIEDRGSQITYSALGQKAPLDAKKTWDPDFKKRQKIKEILEPMLSNLSVRLGGSTSIDVTKPGIDKAYGIEKLKEILGIPIEKMLFVGDAIFPGGNDYPAQQAGVYSIKVRDPEETKSVIKAIIGCQGT